MLVLPVRGRLVRDPATRRIVDDAGVDIDPTDPYWARLLADRDVRKPPDPKPDAAEAISQEKSA